MEKNKVSVEMIVISQPDPNGTERNELESILGKCMVYRVFAN